jgi:uncharacterized damage-inducible protein DinB
MSPVMVPIAADERTTLTGFLDAQRAAVARKAEGLTREQLARTTAASSLTLAGLVHHLALVEDGWFRAFFLGEEPARVWRDVDWEADPEYEFRTALELEPAELLAGYAEACEASRAAVSGAGSLDDVSVTSSEYRGGRISLRWILLHMIEETARHAGHADLLREAIDGSVGD